MHDLRFKHADVHVGVVIFDQKLYGNDLQQNFNNIQKF